MELLNQQWMMIMMMRILEMTSKAGLVWDPPTIPLPDPKAATSAHALYFSVQRDLCEEYFLMPGAILVLLRVCFSQNLAPKLCQFGQIWRG